MAGERWLACFLLADGWVVDPNKQVITAYDFEGDTPPTIYGFDAVVPVGIYGGNCKIDFTTIKEAIDRYKQ